MSENINKTTTRENEEERLIYLKKVAIINKYMRKNHPVMFENLQKNRHDCVDIMFKILLSILFGLITYCVVCNITNRYVYYIIPIILPFTFTIIDMIDNYKIKKNIKLVNTTIVGTKKLIDILNVLDDVDYFYDFNIDTSGNCSYASYDSSYGQESYFDFEKLNRLHKQIDLLFENIISDNILLELNDFNKINEFELKSFIIFDEDNLNLTFKLSEMTRCYGKENYFKSIEENNLKHCGSKHIKIPNDSYYYILENNLKGKELVNYVENIQKEK